MAIKYVVQEEQVVPLRQRGTRKRFWDPDTNSWHEKTIWTVPATRELCSWLQKEYPNFAGWHYVWSDTRVVMEEPIYLFYCLKFSQA